MFISDDPHADFNRWDSACERKRAKLPTCECCGEKIYGDTYDFDGVLVCEECVWDYVNDNYKVNSTED